MRIATFNIQHGRGPDGEVDLGRLAAATALLDADVLALQEVDVEVPRSHGANLAAIAAGEMAFAFAPAMAIGDGWYGNGLAVRGRIGDLDAIELPGEDGDEPRIAMLASIEVDGAPEMSAAVTHLSIREHIARLQLEAVLTALVDRRPPHVLLGDLNLTPRAVEPGIRAAGLTLAEPSAPTFPAHRPSIRIDHLAVGAGLVLERVDIVHTPVSDHRALVGTVNSD